MQIFLQEKKMCIYYLFLMNLQSFVPMISRSGVQCRAPAGPASRLSPVPSNGQTVTKLGSVNEL